ncbi:hypothetical protein PsorP6_004955 [Peronosclerospora sorghi]|uniref:Uncharacterized protein n=1 Tax=Peronosclerospora sorghi TaxID=230839 RepID=A0ACC0W488_9STRA|nr:hypothetical protein PsorP6_004955 [Peronosclerospora sorghi]
MGYKTTWESPWLIYWMQKLLILLSEAPVSLISRTATATKGFSVEQPRVLLGSIPLPNAQNSCRFHVTNAQNSCRFHVTNAQNSCRFHVTTFGEVDGRTLTFTGLKRPCYCCLNLQARVAFMVALKNKSVDASYKFREGWTGVSLNDKIVLGHGSTAPFTHRSI